MPDREMPMTDGRLESQVADPGILPNFSEVELKAQTVLWDSFLEAWPIERLATMGLPEYSKSGDDTTFTRWIESRLSEVGSIWGGSSFKFGIYHRLSNEAKIGGAGRSYAGEYAWYTKYGDSPQTAFANVRALVAEVARAARAGELEKVDKIDLGEAYKWKIAFQYQDRTKYLLTPVFSRLHLATFLKEKAVGQTPQSMLYRRLSEARGSKDVLNFGREVWNNATQSLSKQTLTLEQAEQLLQERFDSNRAPTQYLAGFTTAAGRELALRKGRKVAVRIFVDGDFSAQIPGLTVHREYAADAPRSSNLASQAPTLDVGHPAKTIDVKSMEALRAFCEAYGASGAIPKTTELSPEAHMEPLNQILFGPPGTGKTFHSITRALSIVDPQFLAAHAADRATLKARFDKLAEERRIRFVTFHQSFSYEDFVEGIRAQTDEGEKTIDYRVVPGIFRSIVEDALLAKQGGLLRGVAPDAKVWKISIDGTGPSPRREECFEIGQMRIGWANVGNLSDPARPAEQLDAFEKESPTNKNSLRAFSEEVKPGDIVLCIKSQTAIQAVGVVTGDYQFDTNNPERWRDFVHVRNVNWISTGLNADIRDLNKNVLLTMKTIYELGRISAADAIALAGPVPAAGGPKDARYVLIIDEINRGNISRIFGELITLLEPSKRVGQPEALRITLPYSQKEFQVPDNLYVIGTMNTADRSLTGLDIALRRRFEFIEMPPVSAELEGIVVGGLSIKSLLEVLNQRIEALLDRDHRLGHTYFLPLRLSPDIASLASIFRRSVLPLLQEYFFEDWERIHWVLNDHRKPHDLRFVFEVPASAMDLFGSEISKNVSVRRWDINHAAFDKIESYIRILSSTAV